MNSNDPKGVFMKKIALLSFIVGLILPFYALHAEEPPSASSSPAAAAKTETPAATPTESTAAAANNAPSASENLEFVSGEITATDEAAKTVTVKLYGETENAANDKVLTVKLDETTDITDGEKTGILSRSRTAPRSMWNMIPPRIKRPIFSFIDPSTHLPAKGHFSADRKSQSAPPPF